jgi:preprotein translocase subunit YajC
LFRRSSPQAIPSHGADKSGTARLAIAGAPPYLAGNPAVVRPPARKPQTRYFMFATPAYAQAAGGDAGSFVGALLPFVLIFAIMYFLLIRPQQKKMKEHKAMVDALRRGDKVVTQGGLIGKVTRVKEGEGTDFAELEVELAEGVRVRVVRSTIAQVLSKTEPAD